MRIAGYTLIFFVLTSITTAQVNIDFENTAVGQYTTPTGVAGWTAASTQHTYASGYCNLNSSYNWNQPISEFSIVATPVIGVPFIGIVNHSPLGGLRVAKLNDQIGANLMTKISSAFTVTSATDLLEIAYCGSWEGGSHACCDQPFFSIRLYTDLGQPLLCTDYTATPASSSCTNGVTYSLSSNGVSWTNWQVSQIDLTPFIGQGIVVEITNADCAGWGHHGSVYLDARLRAQNIQPGLQLTGLAGTVAFCPGSNSITMSAPLGYATYSWVAPPSVAPIPASQSTLSTITTASAMPGLTYTVFLNTHAGCIFVMTTTIIPSQITVAGIGSTGTCPGGSAGSATVQGSGSGSGYSYTWTNSNNQAIGNSSVITGLPAGNYSVAIVAAGNSAATCGSAVAWVQVGTASKPAQYQIAHHCSGTASLQASAGSNYQWYVYPNILIANATSQGYFVSFPQNYAMFTVTFTNSGGCSDTTHFILNQVTPGTLTAKADSACPGVPAASATLTLLGSQGTALTYSVFSVGNTPPYFSGASGSAVSNTVSGLAGGGTYSVSLNEAACYYNTTFSVPTLIPPFDFTFSAQQPSICANETFTTQVLFDSVSQFASHSYSWSPGLFLNNGTSQFSLSVSPPSTPGSQANFVYSVVVTPSQGICPLTKSFTLSIFDPLTPTISAIPPLCDNGPSYSIQVLPAGGVFSSTTNLFTNNMIPVIIPSLNLAGTHSFTYAITGGTCVAQTIETVSIIQSPVLSIFGNTVLCLGESTSLYAYGADSYNWSTSANTPSLAFSPTATASYTLTGHDSTKTCVDKIVLKVVVEECIGVDSSEPNHNLKIYPNPTTNKIAVEFPDDYVVDIYSCEGKHLYNIAGAEKLIIDLSADPAGLYFLVVKTKFSLEPKKIVKQ